MIEGRLFDSPDETQDDAHSDARRLGIPASEVSGGDYQGVWPQNVTAVAAAASVVTQLTPTGLDYCRARAGFEMAGIEMPPELWAEVRLVEAGMLKGLHE